MDIKKRYQTLKVERILEVQRSALTGLVNDRIALIEEEIQKLRQQCDHTFSNGVCEKCEQEDI